MKHKIYILLFFIGCNQLLFSQQDPQFTQYMYNMSVINPAYTTSNIGVINIGALYRSQWVGVKGAPKTGTLFLHTPINEKIEVGISFINDDIGDIVKENKISGDFAYKINLREKHALSFGLKAGVSLYDANISNGNIDLVDPSDPNFSRNINKSFFNIGAGVYYNTDKLYLGASIPNILKESYLELNNGVAQGVKENHMFFTGGYVFTLSDKFKFKPAFMARFSKATDPSIDITSNFLYKDSVEFGIGYRLDDSINGLVNFKISQMLRLGYAYDYTTSNLGNYSNGSHEVFLLFDIDANKNGYDKSPRFF